MHATVEDIRTSMQKIIDVEGEDFVYVIPNQEELGSHAACLYVHDDKPSCLIGRVLHDLGMSLEDLSQYEGQDASMPAEAFGVSEHVADALTTAQFVQDTGETWGDALAAFERSLVHTEEMSAAAGGCGCGCQNA